MASYVATNLVKAMIQKDIKIKDANILILGLTFKENCPDIRNTKVVDIVKELKDYEANVDVYDPWINGTESQHEYGITPVSELVEQKYDAIVLAVAHHQFKELGADNIRKLGKKDVVIYDLKYVLDKQNVDIRL